MKTNKQVKNWWIDALLMLGYLFSFYLDITGVIGHQWLGLALVVLAIVHLWLHMDWVKAVTKRLFGKGGARNRWYYLLDMLIVAGFIVILETGLVISTWLDLPLVNYVTWLNLHLYASFATLGLIVVKVGAHWRWVVNTTNRIFGTTAKPTPVQPPMPGQAPVLVPVPVQGTGREVIDRRRFLAMMGVVSLGSILAVSNVISENAAATVNESGNSTGVDTVSAAAEAPTATTTNETVQQVAGSPVDVTAATATAEVATAPAASVTAQPTAQAIAQCSVLCPRGCFFPGSCRRYTDQNANGKCDLGECL